MTFPIMVGLVTLALIALTLVGLGLRRRENPKVRARHLRILAGVATVVVTTLLTPSAWSEGRHSTLMLLSVPLLCVTGAIVADFANRAAAVVTSATAAVMLFVSMRYGLGPMLFFLLPAWLMTCASAASWLPLERRDAAARAEQRRADRSNTRGRHRHG
ncbi:MAG TPA: hypothetical protein VFY56_15490 [Propionibacteriaceae bacterium]|nr:hypothetical protein [Propionibacteriaceae bacterium]